MADLDREKFAVLRKHEFLVRAFGAPYVAIVQVSRALLGNFTNHVFIVYYAQVSKPKTASRS